MVDLRPRILDEIRARSRQVSAMATLVRIRPEAVPALARTLRSEVAALADGGSGVVAGPWDVTDVVADEDRTALVLTLAAVNFGSGYHPVVHKRPGCSGATTMAMAVRDWARSEGPVTARRLTAVTPADAHRIFGQPDDDEAVAELMGLFVVALNDLGNLVLAEHGGSFVALVAGAERSAATLVGQLDALPTFRDRAAYRGLDVPFYKRAQLAAADLARAFAGRGVGAFDDLDDLTAFADNLVPHVLRLDGVLDYDPGLAAAIAAGEPLPAGSEAEVEIRAAGVHAVELLRDELAGQGLGVRSSDLDALLWRRGGAPSYKAVPRHRTRSVFY